MKLSTIKLILVGYINHLLNTAYIIFFSCHGETECPIIPLNCSVPHSRKLFV